MLLPATLPEVFTGLRIGFTVTLLGVLLGEMFASKDGLGSMIMNDMSLAQSEEMMSVAIILFAFAAIANAIAALDRASAASEGVSRYLAANVSFERHRIALLRRLARLDAGKAARFGEPLRACGKLPVALAGIGRVPAHRLVLDVHALIMRVE